MSIIKKGDTVVFLNALPGSLHDGSYEVLCVYGDWGFLRDLGKVTHPIAYPLEFLELAKKVHYQLDGYNQKFETLGKAQTFRTMRGLSDKTRIFKCEET